MGIVEKPVISDMGDHIVGAAIARRATQSTLEHQDRLISLMNLQRARHHQGGVLGNMSGTALTLWQAATPRQGAWAVPPTALAPATPSTDLALTAWKASGNAPAAAMDCPASHALDEAMQYLLATWIEQSLVMEPAAHFGLKSRGGGVEGITVYHDTAQSLAAAFYLMTSDTGSDVTAGAAILGFDEMQGQLARDDGYLTDLRRQIQLGDGEAFGLSRGNTLILRRDPIRISFRAGPQVAFLIAQDG